MRASAMVALLALALSACAAPEIGLSGRDDELERQRIRSGGVVVVSATPERAVFLAGGRQLVVVPPEGHCLDPDTATARRGAGFVLVADCPAGTAHPAFPGILTVTVSADPGFTSDAGGIDGFEALVTSPAGRRLLSRGNSHAPGRVLATRRIGDALYVLIEEEPNGAAEILQPRFWRAFVDLGGRLALVTLSGFADSPMGVDAMLAFLVGEVAELRAANGLPPVAEENEVAASASGAAATQAPVAGSADATDVALGGAVPLPPRRPRRERAPHSAPGAAPGSAVAPGRRLPPPPPPRPG